MRTSGHGGMPCPENPKNGEKKAAEAQATGTGVLKVDGKEVATQKMERTLLLILQRDETFDIGADAGTPVDEQDYQVPFKLTGKLNKLTLTINRPKLSPEDIKKLEAAQRNNKVSE